MNNITNKQLKRLVNVYQLKYTNGVAQGLGDYIRGCFCLLQISVVLGLQFDMDLTNHPMSKFLVKSDIKYDDINYQQIAKYENINYIPINSQIYEKDTARFLNEFIKNMNALKTNVENYYTFCNSFPILDNFTDNSRRFIRSKLAPNELMQQHIQAAMNNLQLKARQFAVIHIRNGDKYMLKNNQLNPFVIKKIVNTLVKSLKPGTKYLVLSDNNQIKILLKKIFPQLIIQMTNIMHLGESVDPREEAIVETLLDFYLMSNAYQIVSFSPYNWGSGFSQWCSVLHNIPFTQIQVLDRLS